MPSAAFPFQWRPGAVTGWLPSVCSGQSVGLLPVGELLAIFSITRLHRIQAGHTQLQQQQQANKDHFRYLPSPVFVCCTEVLLWETTDSLVPLLWPGVTEELGRCPRFSMSLSSSLRGAECKRAAESRNRGVQGTTTHVCGNGSVHEPSAARLWSRVVPERTHHHPSHQLRS